MSETGKQRNEENEGGTREPDRIRADIDQTRAELGDTAAALAEKADVKARSTAKLEEVKQQASQKAQKLTDEKKPLVLIGVALVAVVILGRLLSR